MNLKIRLSQNTFLVSRVSRMIEKKYICFKQKFP